MRKNAVRKRYFIHPSSQLKYIMMSILPALILSIFSVSLLFTSGELILEREKGVIFEKAASINSTVTSTLAWLARDKYSPVLIEKINWILKELVLLENIFKTTYFNIVKQWAEAKTLIFTAVFLVLIMVGTISLLYSHRIAGAIYRLRKDVDMLSKGKDIPPIRLRKHDEFKELADSLEKLRQGLKEKGFLRPQ